MGSIHKSKPRDIGLRLVIRQTRVDLLVLAYVLRRQFDLGGRNGRAIAPAASAVGYRQPAGPLGRWQKADRSRRRTFLIEIA